MDAIPVSDHQRRHRRLLPAAQPLQQSRVRIDRLPIADETHPVSIAVMTVPLYQRFLATHPGLLSLRRGLSLSRSAEPKAIAMPGIRSRLTLRK
jgi:hypothetical protein